MIEYAYKKEILEHIQNNNFGLMSKQDRQALASRLNISKFRLDIFLGECFDSKFIFIKSQKYPYPLAVTKNALDILDNELELSCPEYAGKGAA
jgi:hypothetical protein